MYCSRCGKKVLDSMLYCPFCGAQIIIPEQDSSGDADITAQEPVKAEPLFSFDLPEEAGGTSGSDEIIAETRIPETKLSWEDLIEPEPEPLPKREPVTDAHAAQEPEKPVRTPEEPVHAPESERPQEGGSRDSAAAGDVVPGRRSADTLVPDKALVIDKASMFMDDADDFDDLDDFDDDTDDFDAYEEALERESRKNRQKKRKGRYRDDDADDEDRGFIANHIRGIVGILLFLILLALLAFYALSDPGQMSLAKINATLPLRPEIYSKIAFEYYQAEDYTQSGVYYERALARDPGSYNYASSAAMAYISAGDNDKAAEILRKCIQLKPEAVEPYVYLLNLYPNANSRPWDVAQLLKQGYELTGDARLAESTSDAAAQN